MIDFTLPERVAEIRDRIDAFIRDEIIPLESDPRQTGHGPSEELRRELVARGRKAGVLTPQMPQEWGGLGLDARGMAVAFEAGGYSPLGPLALNIQAPDEGNMHLLEVVATPEQREKWLRPLVAGEIRSVFSMTEPDGAGSDPSLLKTEARETEGGDFVINGTKWLITGAPGASLNIIMARTFDRGGEDVGATMFLTDVNDPGFKLERMLDTMDSNSPGGHGVVTFTDLRATRAQVLGEVGRGFRYAQVRLAPARLTHCMRWLGAARRCHDIATQYAREREAFGKRIGEHEGVGFMLADNEIDLQACRLMIWHAAWLLDQGAQARQETSIAKVFCSERLGQVVDRCVQILGGKGITRDTVVERTYRDIRAFRIYDGPSEVHRWALQRHILGRNL